MDLRHLQEFVTLGVCLNFTEAARRLYMAQSSLSTHIALLEREIGGKLFERDGSISLTPLGEALLEDASVIVQLHDSALKRCRELAKNPLPQLTIARDQIAIVGAGTDLRHYQYAFAQENPQASLRYRPCEESDVEELLAQGSDFVAIPYAPLPVCHADEVRYAAIPQQGAHRLALMVSRENSLAERPSLKWHDLHRISIPYDSSGTSHIWFKAVTEVFNRHGIEVLSRYDSRGEDFFDSFRADEVQLFDTGLIEPVLEHMGHSHVLVPIDEPDAVARCYVAFLSGNDNPLLARFVAPLEPIETPSL